MSCSEQHVYIADLSTTKLALGVTRISLVAIILELPPLKRIIYKLRTQCDQARVTILPAGQKTIKLTVFFIFHDGSTTGSQLLTGVQDRVAKSFTGVDCLEGSTTEIIFMSRCQCELSVMESTCRVHV